MKRIALLLATLFGAVCALAQTTINFADYAAAMGGEKNAKVVFEKILKDTAGMECVTITLPKGRYDFYPSVYTQDGPYEVGIAINGVKDFTLDGEGSEFICHGMMEFLHIRNSENVTFKNFSVDWERPLATQCTVKEMTDDYVDVTIDPVAYPYVIEDGKLLFTGEGWKLPISPTSYNIMFTPEGEIAYNTWDEPLPDVSDSRVEQIDENTVRFHNNAPCKFDPGYFFVIYQRGYGPSGISVYDSKDTLFEDVTIYHSMGHAFYFQMCENVTELGVKLIPNKSKGRVFSSVADGTHFLNCKGTMTLRGCEYAGQGDDFLNVHGRNTRIKSISEGKVNLYDVRHTVLFTPGDTVAFVGQVSGQRDHLLTVKESSEGQITFNEPIPDGVETGYVLENMTWTAGLVFENNVVTKCNRARGILITTPRKSIVRNNVFHSAGTAILIEGDTDVWFESGACGDLTITGNIFDNCLTSGNRDDNRWQWGDGIITITPSHRPKDADAPAYHKNIKIENNEFRVFDVPLLRACSVDGLTFKGNKIVKTYDYKPYTWYKDSFVLEGCRNVVIKGNKIDKAYTTRTVKGTIMKKSDVKARGFKVAVEQ